MFGAGEAARDEMAKLIEHSSRKRVLVYSESKPGAPVYGDLGDRRWTVTVYELTDRAEKRRKADPDNYEHDRDTDEVECSSSFKTFEQAVAVAKRQAPGSVYGSATVQEEQLEWYVEEHHVGEGEACGPEFEVDSNGDAAKV